MPPKDGVMYDLFNKQSESSLLIEDDAIILLMEYGSEDRTFTSNPFIIESWENCHD